MVSTRIRASKRRQWGRVLFRPAKSNRLSRESRLIQICTIWFEKKESFKSAVISLIIRTWEGKNEVLVSCEGERILDEGPNLRYTGGREAVGRRENYEDRGIPPKSLILPLRDAKTQSGRVLFKVGKAFHHPLLW